MAKIVLSLKKNFRFGPYSKIHLQMSVVFRYPLSILNVMYIFRIIIIAGYILFRFASFHIGKFFPWLTFFIEIIIKLLHHKKLRFPV